MIDLDIVDTVAYDRKPIFTSGGAYLYDEHSLVVTAVYNPMAMSYESPAIGDHPAKTEGKLAALTDANVRDWLSQPRRQLVYRVGNNEVLRSPRAGMAMDAAKGPFTQVLRIQQVSGWKTFLVQFAVKTFINEAWKRTGVPPAVLAHHWNRERSVDTDGYATLVTQGRATFNAEQMFPLLLGPVALAGSIGGYVAAAVSPDDFLDNFLHPLEHSWRRDSIQVSVNEDNLECDYVVIDREMPVSMIAKGVARMEAYHTATLGRGTAEEVAKGITTAIQSAGKGALRGGATGAAAFAWTGPLGASIAGGLGAAGGAILEFFNHEGTRAAVPKVSHQMSVSLWGNRLTTRSRLEQVGKDLITQRISQVIAPNTQKLFGFQTSVTHDLGGMFVHIEVTFTGGPLLSLATGAAQGNLFKVFPVMPSQENYDGILDSTGALISPGGLRAGQSRGTYLGCLLAQAMVGAATRPPLPPQPRRHQSL